MKILLLWFIAALPICCIVVRCDDIVVSTEFEDLHKKLPADFGNEPPTILVAILVRNKAHVLPLFLSYFERQNYSKQRMALWIRSDHNSDASCELLQLWLKHVSHLYHSIDFTLDNNIQTYENESSPYSWTAARYQHLIHLKESALKYAQQIWADYIFFLDADVFLTYADTLNHLTSLQLPIVSPMLLSEGLYSNFWCGMTPEYYYQRTDEYKEIYNIDKEGVFQVPMVHSAVMINMNYVGTRYLTFDREHLLEQQKQLAEFKTEEEQQCRPYDGPLDDIIIFAISAKCSEIPLFISNKYPYGYLLQPLEASDTFEQDLQQLVNIRANIVHDHGSVIPVNNYFEKYISFPKKSTLTLDHIFMINLMRRPQRRIRMENLFKELGLDVEYFSAVDGKDLNLNILKEMNITFLSGYEDPYHHRQMTMGEVGCFLSHYRIWEEIVTKAYKEVLILEDDIRFQPYFKDSAIRVLDQVRSVAEYDLMYFGRKRLKEESEPWVKGTENVVHVGYSYWTLGYVISQKGAQKLLAAKPLENLVPVDEFLPIMFNRHPNRTWSKAFPVRDLIAFSAAPLLLFPTHYTGEEGYISDTEDSEITPQLDNTDTFLQRKSDREKEFESEKSMKDEEISQFEVDNGRNFLNLDLHVSKSHEEL